MQNLEEALKANVTQGIHDYELCRTALLELAFLYGTKPVPEQPLAHCLIAANCLLLAAKVSQLQWDLQENVGAHKVCAPWDLVVKAVVGRAGMCGIVTGGGSGGIVEGVWGG